MSDRRVSILSAAACAVALALAAGTSDAQVPAGRVRASRFETRPELEAAANLAESQHHSEEARLLRARLEHGDFQQGDRIILSIEAPGADAPPSPGVIPVGGTDTVVVRADDIVQFKRIPNIPDLSLVGVLRSELVDTITAHLRKFVRNPIVRAVPLMRVAVMGAVVHPGWYSTPGDVVLADIIMQAGGVNGESDLQKTVIRRAGEEIWPPAEVRTALADGLSLDELHLRAGDEIEVPARRRWDLMTTVQLLTAAAGIYVAMLTIRNSHR